MGMYSVDIQFDCKADDGTDLSGLCGQEMDAFIGYGGKGPMPPHFLRVTKDRIVVDHEGKMFDPKEWGYASNEAEPYFFEHGFGIRLVVHGGSATVVEVFRE